MTCGAHIKNLKKPVEFQLPSHDFFLIVPCMEILTNCTSFALLFDIPLDLPHSPEIKPKVPLVSCSIACCWCDSHCQLRNHLRHRVFEVLQFLPAQPPAEGSSDTSTGQPEFNVVRLVCHHVLGPFQPVVGRRKTRKILTFIVMRMMLTEPKTALAGVMLETSFTRFKTSMAVFNPETTPSHSIGHRDLASMIVKVAAREP